MKKLILLTLLIAGLFTAFNASAQKGDKSKRPSPPDTAKATLKSGVDIEVAYSQPSIKGRSLAGELTPYGKVWRLGANEATTFTVSKNVKIDGKELPAGKYGLYAIPGEKEWVFIFNSVWNIWGLNYTRDEVTGAKTDVLRVTVKAEQAPELTEKMKFFIDPAGKVYFLWGSVKVGFQVK